MALYAPVWMEIARVQYAELPNDLKQSFDAVFAAILDDPKGGGSYDKATDQWTALFGDGRGLLTYAVNDDFVKVIVPRIVS